MNKLTGNILDIETGIIVHGCNCQGVMGSGVAKAIRAKYPGVYHRYEELHYREGLKLGTVQVVVHPELARTFTFEGVTETAYLPAELVVVNAMTQQSFGPGLQVSYDAITQCFKRVKTLAEILNYPVYFPLIGAGLGGGDWAEISKRIDAALGPEIDATLVVLE